MFAIGIPLVLQVYLLFSIVVLAFEESDHYVEAAAVTVVAVLVEQYVIVLPGLGRIRVVERWAAGREVDRGSALRAEEKTSAASVRRSSVTAIDGLRRPRRRSEFARQCV